MSNEQPNNPLHGINLKQLVERLVAYYGWEQLGLIIEIGCFNYKPSVTSSLRFLRSTPWARAKVEKLYIIMQDEIEQTNQGDLPESSPTKFAKPVEPQQDSSLDEQNKNVESNKPYRGLNFEHQKSTEPQTTSKFKFEYRKSGASPK
ncbi:MAG: VF530 family protein [Victivallaceae bacterium]|nr:VF530 family protein [Victivallaceae bacterium]